MAPWPPPPPPSATPADRATCSATASWTRRIAMIDEGTDPAALSIRAVTKRAGVSPTAFYLHFAHRDELVAAMIDRCFTEFRDAVRKGAAGATDPADRLDRSGMAYADFARRWPARYALNFLFMKPDEGEGEAPEKPVAANDSFNDLVTLVLEYLPEDDPRRDEAEHPGPRHLVGPARLRQPEPDADRHGLAGARTSSSRACRVRGWASPAPRPPSRTRLAPPATGEEANGNRGIRQHRDRRADRGGLRGGRRRGGVAPVAARHQEGRGQGARRRRPPGAGAHRDRRQGADAGLEPALHLRRPERPDLAPGEGRPEVGRGLVDASTTWATGGPGPPTGWRSTWAGCSAP